MSGSRWVPLSLLLVFLMHAPAATEPAATGQVGGVPHEISLTVTEPAMMKALRAATPHVVTVGNSLLSVDLILMDPSHLVLSDGRASLRFRVRGRSLPVDTVLTAQVTVKEDPEGERFFAVISSLPIQVTGLGRIDLKDYLPPLEIPALLENLWRFEHRPIGLNLRVKRIAILKHRVEIGAEVHFAPVSERGRN